MKRTTFLGLFLCLGIGSIKGANIAEHQPIKGTEFISKIPGTTAKKEPIKLIPAVKLSLTVNEYLKKLQLQSSGLDGSLKEWTIFKPKGPVISKMSTKAVFDEVDIKNFSKGKYLLMIKDLQGRALFRSFVIS